MEGQQVAQSIGWLGETWGFWIQTGALFVSALWALWTIKVNGSMAKKRALIDLIIQQKSDQSLIDATQLVYKLAENGKKLSTLVEEDTAERKAILKVLNNQEFIAAGIRMGAFDESVYKQMQCSNVLKLWSAAAGFVHEIRRVDKLETLFQDFECLALRWRVKPIKQLKK